MNLYLVSTGKDFEYDTYDAVVVAAENENDARRIHPYETVSDSKSCKWDVYSDLWVGFCDIDSLEVEFLGVTDKDRGVVLASYNGS